MNIIFLDIDGVLATHKQYGTQRSKLHAKDPHAKALNIPYMWDERCVIAFNRFVLMNDLEIVLSSDWRLHWNLDELNTIFKLNGVAKSPFAITNSAERQKFGESQASLRIREIRDYVEINKIETWCAVDDMDLSTLGTRFVKTDERTGFAARDFAEKIEYALHPHKRFASE